MCIAGDRNWLLRFYLSWYGKCRGLAVADVADAQHHVSHFQETASADELSRAAEILELLGQGELHDAEHEIRELLGEEEHGD